MAAAAPERPNKKAKELPFYKVLMIQQNVLRRAFLVGELEHGHCVPAFVVGCPVADAGHAVGLAPFYYVGVDVGLALLVVLVASHFLVSAGERSVHLA